MSILPMRGLPNCLACGSKQLIKFLSLGFQCLANDFHVILCEPMRYELWVMHCGDCGHKQLHSSAPADNMFRYYHYRSGVSETLRQHFRELAKEIVLRHGKCRVLDIACNDGTFLEELEAVGCDAVGIDPAMNLVEIAIGKGLDAHCGYWTQEAATSLGKFDVITALNVLAHTDDPLRFLMDCRQGLNPGGTLIVQTSQVDWIENGEFDCVYHEHVSYFTEESIFRLARRAGYEVEETRYLPIHGKSRRTYLSDPIGRINGTFRQSIQDARECVAYWKGAGYSVWGYGAAAKGMIRLNTAEVCLDAIADDTPEKQGLVSPGMNIPIVKPETMKKPKRLAVVILAWNFAEEIIEKVLSIRDGKETVFISAHDWKEVQR